MCKCVKFLKQLKCVKPNLIPNVGNPEARQEDDKEDKENGVLDPEWNVWAEIKFRKARSLKNGFKLGSFTGVNFIIVFRARFSFVRKICTFNVDEIDGRCQFYQYFTRFFCQYPFAKKLISQAVTKKKHKKALSYEKFERKMLMKLTPDYIPLSQI